MSADLKYTARADDSATPGAAPQTGCAKYIRDIKNDCGHFKVLMWKHMTVRIRKFIKTIIEIIAPCFLFLILHWSKSFLLDLSEKQNQPATKLHGFSGGLETVPGPRVVLYNPVNQFTNELMAQVGGRLDLMRTDFLPVGGELFVYYGFPNDFRPLVYYLAKTRDGTAVVEFKSLENNVWPKRLTYSIKMKHKRDSTTGTKSGDYKRFMRLQWAIDSSFIRIISNNSAGAPISLNEVPLKTEPPAHAASVVILCEYVLPSVVQMSLLLPFLFLLSRLMQDRGSGVQELLCQAGVSYSVLANSHGCNTIPTGLVYALCGTLVVMPFLPLSNGLLFFLGLQLNFHSFVTWAFLCSFVNKSGDYSTTLGIMFFIFFYVMSQVILKYSPPWSHIWLSVLLPHAPYSNFIKEIYILEVGGKGLSFSEVMKAHSKNVMSVAQAFLAMSIQIVLLLIISQYLNDVRPGKYGISKPCFSICRKKDKVAHTALEEIEEEKLSRDPMYFEDTKLTNVGIRIENVSKIFDKFVALSNVTFNVYKGEITVLLGHNGAGKTTILSIIAGTLSLTKGRVFVQGYDITHEKSKVQSMIGTCPQHNIFFPDLTVLEHVRLFAMLRGSSFKEAKISSQELLDRLNLHDKGKFKADQLSGGMKRRLQLACALTGDSSVLILDEPTSGLDVETRRELWDLLQALRGTRTVLLTTHFMEEADALGDRVAALHAGRLRCHATPMYLKKNIGTGYRLTLNTVDKIPKEEEITATIQKVIPNATLKATSLHSISYNLPSQDHNKFSAMFTALENQKEKLGIESIGVGATSLEEVFLKLCSDTETTFTDENVDTDRSEPEYHRITGCPLFMRHITVLLKRQIRFVWTNKLNFLLMQTILPTLVSLLLAYFFFGIKPENPEEKEKLSSKTAMNLDFNDSDGLGKGILLLRTAPDMKPAAMRLSEHYENVNIEYTDSVFDKLFRASNSQSGSKNNSGYNLGIEVHDIYTKIFYTTPFQSVVPVVLNLLSNILAAYHQPDYESSRVNGRIISALYEPMEDADEDASPLADIPQLNRPPDYALIGMFTIFWICLFIGVIVNSVRLPIVERETGTRHIHLMAGVSPLIHWLTTFIFHIFVYSLILIIPSLLVLLIDYTGTFAQGMFHVCCFVILLMSLMAMLTMCYLLSFTLSMRAVNLLMIFSAVIFGFIPGLTFLMYKVMKLQLMIYVKIPVLFCYYVIPMATGVVGFLKVILAARKNMLCNQNLDLCPQLLEVSIQIAKEADFDANKCCSEKKGTYGYLGFSGMQAGIECVILAAQTIVYFTLVILTQKGIFNGLIDRLFNKRYKPDPNESTDYNIVAEKNYVEDEMDLHPGNRGDVMLVNNVHKKYFKCCSKSVNAVKGLSFSVKKGECFGLLGVNGAGKSTTFKMISAEEVTTRGGIYANGYDLKWPRNSGYLQSLSYCPQFFGLDNFETGYNNLMTLLIMRGLNSDDATLETNTWIETVGLERYRNNLVEGYSGGCERRLATAAALSSGAPLSLLDEPTAGVDVSARRRVWVALRKGLRQGRAVIITSHSMDEMEALCDRILIMAEGKAVALGSASALRAAYATGHALIIKMSEADPEDVKRLKETITSTFDCTLVDEHATMLQYHINVQMRYSELFSTLQDLKSNFQPDIIEDYSISETTLEEVFLSFAKKK